jgi:hypothetical protein
MLKHRMGMMWDEMMMNFIGCVGLAMVAIDKCIVGTIVILSYVTIVMGVKTHCDACPN